MRLISLILLLLPAVALGNTLATVDGQPITEAMVVSVAPAAATNPQVRESTLQVLISRMLLADVARKSTWLDRSRVAAALSTQRIDLLSNAAAQQYWQTHPISKTALDAAYHKALATLPSMEYRFREIVVAKQAKAIDLLDRLRKGASFSQLAAQDSLLPNAPLGGETGWVGENTVPAPYLKVMAKGQMDAVYGPLVVPRGWAIVQLLGRRHTPQPRLDAVRAQLEGSLRNQELEKYVAQLRKAAKIVYTKEGSDAHTN